MKGILLPLTVAMLLPGLAAADAAAPQPLAYYPFEDKAVNVLRITEPAVNNGGEFMPGYAGNALYFGGNDMFVNYSDTDAFESVDQLTISYWLRMDELPAASEYYIPVGKDFDGTPSFRFVINGAGNTHFIVRTENNGWYDPDNDGQTESLAAASAQTKLTPNQWYFITGVYDGTKARIYINGQYEGQCSYNLSGRIYDGTADFHIGSKSYEAISINSFKGSIDEVKVWDTALSDEQVEGLHNESSGIYVPEPRVAESDYLVGAMYMPIWKLGTHWGWTSIEDYPDRKPLLGYYDEGTPEVADWHIKWALEHGVSFFTYVWSRCNPCFGPGEVTADNIRLGHAIHDGLFEARYREGINYTIMLLPGPPWIRTIYSLDDLQDNLMPFLIETYFKDPQYLVIDNKPVLFIYAPLTIMNEELSGTNEMRQALQIMRQTSQAAGFDGLIIIGENRYSTLIDEELIDLGFDYVFPYVIPAVPYNPTPAQAIQSQKDFLELRLNSNTPFIPVAGMGWDVVKDTLLSRWRLNPNEFKTALQNAKDIMSEIPSDRLGHRMILLDNWNEFSEGHYIEPHEQYGFGYLQSTRDVFSDNNNDPDYRLPEDVGTGPHDTWYQDLEQFHSTERVAAHYTLDEDGSDMSGNSHDGVMTGAEIVDGRIGNAARLDGEDDYIEVQSHYHLDGMQTLSFGGWVKFESTDSPVVPFGKLGSYRILLQTYGGHCVVATSEPEYGWYKAAALWYDPLVDPLGNAWAHLLCVYNGTNIVMYIDGEQIAVSEPMQGSTLASGGPFAIGAGLEHGEDMKFFKGRVDEVMVWNYALTGEEILELYEEGKCHRADSDKDGCITMGEMVAFIDHWMLNSTAYPMREMMEAVSFWKSGTGCS